jgi:hypothetical protein
LHAAWSGAEKSTDSELERVLAASVNEIVKSQAQAGVDIPNDGELGKPMRSKSDLAAWGTYIFGRLDGFGPTPAGAAAPDRAIAGQPMRIVGQRWEQRQFRTSTLRERSFRARHRARRASDRSRIAASTRYVAILQISRLPRAQPAFPRPS